MGNHLSNKNYTGKSLKFLISGNSIKSSKIWHNKFKGLNSHYKMKEWTKVYLK